MGASQFRPADRAIRWVTTGSVVLLAGIAAVVSYQHMYTLVVSHGETRWAAALLPLSVDGMIAASSMSLLLDSRRGRRGGLLPWTLLAAGSAASLSANVAVAEPSLVGRLIAAWPSFALIGAYELLMRQIRHEAERVPQGDVVTDEVPQVAADRSYELHTYEPASPPASDEPQTNGVPVLLRPSPNGSHTTSKSGNGTRQRSPTTRRSAGPALQRQAWEWALANRTSAGDLPAGKAIAEHFNRHERWGRMVKQRGASGRLGPISESFSCEDLTTVRGMSAG